MLALSAIDQMFIIPACPFWSLMIIAVDVVAPYGRWPNGWGFDYF
jgi:hypothetical protein